MPQGEKSAYIDKQNRQVDVIEKGHEQKGVARPGPESRAWATVNKIYGGGKNGSGRKVPFGPVGGLGRKPTCRVPPEPSWLSVPLAQSARR